MLFIKSKEAAGNAVTLPASSLGLSRLLRSLSRPDFGDHIPLRISFAGNDILAVGRPGQRTNIEAVLLIDVHLLMVVYVDDAYLAFCFCLAAVAHIGEIGAIR